MAVKKIWIDRHAITRSRFQEHEPIFRIAIGPDLIKAWSVKILGPSEFKFDMDDLTKPLPQVWLETESEIEYE